jgi:hypothetical protein
MPIEFFCTQCGRLLRTGDDTAGRQAKCPDCGAIVPIPIPTVVPVNIATAPPPSPPNVPNFFMLSILSTLLCCPPTGIVALIYSAQVGTKMAAGDYPGAMAAAEKAQIWCWVSIGIGVVLNMLMILQLYFLFNALGI